jgi:tetratricopeptide (TPR) repeat protein
MVALAVAVGLLLSTQPEEARDRARDAFAQGQELYRAGDFAGALAAFQTAEALQPRPAVEYNIGRCHERLGQLSEAVAAYERYLAGAPTAPDHDAVAEHVAKLRGALPPQGRLKVSVEPSGALVTIDQFPPQPAPVDQLLPAGHHVVLAELSGYAAAHRDVELPPGAALQLELTLRPPEPTPEARAPDAAVHQDIPPASARPTSGERKWTYVALAVAVVAAGAGIAFGASANTAQDQLHSRVHTQAAAQQLYDTANARAAAANGFYAGAAVAGGTAVTLFFLEPSLGHSP